MTNLKDIYRGYAGVKMRRSHWIHTFREDARILREQGNHHEARLIMVLCFWQAAELIGDGC